MSFREPKQCVQCCELVCLCNQAGKLTLKTLRGGTDNLSERCGLTSRNRLTPELPLLWLPRRTPDAPGLIGGTQEAQQWTYHHPATWQDVAATPLCRSERKPALVHWSYTPAEPNLRAVCLSNRRLWLWTEKGQEEKKKKKKGSKVLPGNVKSSWRKKKKREKEVQ